MRTNRGRRLYVFLAVTLAVFVFLITLTGIVCDGFATANSNSKADAALPTTSEDNTKAATEAEAEVSAAQRRTAAALKKYEAAHAKFTEFLTRHFAELVRQEADHATPGPRMDVLQNGANKATENPHPQMAPNPAWEKMDEQLADLKRRRTDLLAKLTESHPLVQQVDLAITGLEQQIEDVPPKIPDARNKGTNSEPALVGPQTSIDSLGATGSASGKSTDSASGNSTGEASGTQWQENAARFRELSQRVEAAERSYHAALKNEKSAWRGRAETPSASAIAAAAPEDRSAAGGARPYLSMYLCGLVSLAVGAMVAFRARAREPTFRTAAEVRQSLSIPVLGVLPREPHAPPCEQPRREAKWVRRCVQTAEIWLLAVVALLAITALADRHFFFDLVADPLATCSKKFWC